MNRHPKNTDPYYPDHYYEADCFETDCELYAESMAISFMAPLNKRIKNKKRREHYFEWVRNIYYEHAQKDPSVVNDFFDVLQDGADEGKL